MYQSFFTRAVNQGDPVIFHGQPAHSHIFTSFHLPTVHLGFEVFFVGRGERGNEMGWQDCGFFFFEYINK